MDTAKDYLQQQKDKFLQDFNGRMQALNKKIDDLQAEADKATPEMKAKIQTAINKLQGKTRCYKETI